MYPKKSKFLVEAFKDATIEPFSYLLVDLRPNMNEKFHVRSNIFLGQHSYVYISK